MSFLKINKDTQGSSGVPLPAPLKVEGRSEVWKTGYEFPTCTLKSVRYNPEKKVTRDGEESLVPALEFLFKDAKDRQFTLVEFPVDMTDAKIEMKSEALQQRVKHIWEETIGHDIPLEVEGNTFAEFFESVGTAFNSHKISVPSKTAPKEGEEQKMVERVLYGTKIVYLKLVYYKTRLQIPMYPNFIQLAVKEKKQVPCETLIINPSNDQIEPTVAPKANAAYGAPATEAGFAGGDMDMDLPDV